MTLKVRKKTPLSARHLKGAQLSLVHAKTSERAENRTSYEAYVINTIISSISFLEGEINNFINTASNLENLEYGENGKNFGLDFKTKARFNYWIEDKDRRKELRNKDTLEKAQFALKVVGRKKFSKGMGIYQRTDIVRDLRNHLVHDTPKLRPAGGETMDYELNNKLQSYVDNSPLASPGDPDFPDKKLSYDCAQWCLKNCIQFSNEFRNRTGWDITNKELRRRITEDY